MKHFLVEARLLGLGTWLAPALLVACLSALLIELGALSGMQSARVFLAWFGARGMMPLLAGMIAAHSASTGSVRELHATLPIAFRRVLLTRFTLIAGMQSIGVGTLYALALSLGLWPQTMPKVSAPTSEVAGLMGCLISLGWCAAVGWCAALVLQSPAAGRVVLVFAWLGIVASSALVLSPEQWWLLQICLFISGGSGIWCTRRLLREPITTWPAQEEWE